MATHALKVDFGNIREAAKEFVNLTRGYRVFSFSGELGAGKTTFISAVCKELGVEDVVSSPTFSIVQQYNSLYGDIFHIDLYRIRNEEEAVSAGIEDSIDSGNICFIEWPERAQEILPSDTVRVEIEIESRECRRLRISIPQSTD